MNPRRGVALVLLLALVSGCAPASSSSRNSGSPPRGSTAPRVRCLSDPARDDASGSRPLFYFFCAESP